MIVAGLSFLFGGLAGAYVIWSQYEQHKMAYVFDPNHTMEKMFILFVVLFFVGVVLTVLGFFKSRNQNTMNKLMNNQKMLNGQAVCKNCGLNLADGCLKCPKCGTEIIK